LKKNIGIEYEVFPQVHLDSILDERVKGQSWKGALSHIQRKSVDFVICSKESLTPLCAVEIDGSSHDSEARMSRDSEVERIFEEARLPLLRYRRNGTIAPEVFIEIIKEELAKN
jgi:very-short-patch-repair endonuclease